MIERLHWDTVVPTTDIESSQRAERWLAIWPSPTDADACFANAGFTKFADSDDVWDQQWQSIIAEAISDLSTYGPPTIRQPVVPVTLTRPVDRLRGASKYRDVPLTLTEQIVLSSRDDQFPPAIVDFGNQPQITLTTCDGHAVIWLRYIQVMSPYHHERDIKAWHDYEFTQFKLDWRGLGPPKMSAGQTDERDPG